jgi:dipeptidyl aminopeptidase/acylaminoacyl peptidase
MLWIRSLDSGSSNPLAGTEGAFNPFWSADNRGLGFFADGQLKTVEVAGGPVLAVAAAPSQAGASWSADGTILFVPAWGKGVYSVASTGGNPILIAAPNVSKFTYYVHPIFLPDGKHFLYLAGGADPAATGTYFASLDGKEKRLVVRGATGALYSAGYLLYVRDGSLMAQAFDFHRGQLKGDPQRIADEVGLYSVSENGTLVFQRRGAFMEKQLTWFDRTGKNLGVTGETGDYWDLRLSPDGQKLATNAGSVAGSFKTEIRVDELARAVRIRLTIDPGTRPGVPVWSPDGSRLAFGTSGSKAGIYQTPANGGGSEELLLLSDGSDPEIWPTSWSPDGRFILYGRGPKRILQTDICILPLEREHKARVFIKAQASDGQFSPDSRWVAYTSKESGREEVYVVRFDAARIWNPASESVSDGRTGRLQVSATGGRCPRWRSDGKELFYLSPAGQMMVAALEDKGKVIEVLMRQVLFKSPLDAPSFAPYDVTPDGKKFVINLLNQQNVPLTLMLNWKANLKKQ